MVYEWCSLICENRCFEDWESLLLDSLEIGFRHLDSLEIGFRQFDSRCWRIGNLHLAHTECQRRLVDVVFKSKNNEAIADLLHACVVGNGRIPLGTCTEHLVGLHNLVPFSSRLRRLAIRSVELIGYKRFEEAGVGRFAELLNHLDVSVEDVEYNFEWIPLLLDVIRTPEGARCLSNQSWELLVELTISESVMRYGTYSSQVMGSLLDAQEWDKLECWIGVVWMMWPPETEETTEDLKRVMASLFRHRPGAAQKLRQWMKRRCEGCDEDESVPKSFERICKQAHEALKQGIS